MKSGEKETFKWKNEKETMKHKTRAALGFVGGMSFLVGILSFITWDPFQMIVGVIALVLGIAAFYYGYTG